MYLFHSRDSSAADPCHSLACPTSDIYGLLTPGITTSTRPIHAACSCGLAVSPEGLRELAQSRIPRCPSCTHGRDSQLRLRIRLYHPHMSRCLAVIVSCFATTLAGLSFAVTASANPAGDGGAEPSCSYTLSKPEVVQVSETTMVRATLTPYPCTGAISPNSLTVCLSPQGSSAPPVCGFSAVPSNAQVFAPYKPGTTYTTTGRGCGSVYTTQGSICTTLGPVETTL